MLSEKKVSFYSKVASADTDVFISAIYHSEKLMFFNLEGLWFISCQRNPKTIALILELVKQIESKVIEVFQGVHALTSCDTTNKVRTALSALKVVKKYGYELLHYLVKNCISGKMKALVKTLLLQCN